MDYTEYEERIADLSAEAGYLASINAVQEATISRLTAALQTVRDWHDGDLDDDNWDKVIAAVRAALATPPDTDGAKS